MVSVSSAVRPATAIKRHASEWCELDWSDTDLSEFVKRSGTDLRQLIRQM